MTGNGQWDHTNIWIGIQLVSQYKHILLHLRNATLDDRSHLYVTVIQAYALLLTYKLLIWR